MDCGHALDSLFEVVGFLGDVRNAWADREDGSANETAVCAQISDFPADAGCVEWG